MRNMYEANKYGWRQISNYRCDSLCADPEFFFQLGGGGVGGPRDHCVCPE